MKSIRFTACTQDGCDVVALVSLVWPGKGRLPYCATHALKAMHVLQALGLSAESLDIKPMVLELVDEPDPTS